MTQQSHLQFFVCSGTSSSRMSAYRAAFKDRPLIPSPHSFTALQVKRTIKMVHGSPTLAVCTGCLIYKHLPSNQGGRPEELLTSGANCWGKILYVVL